MITETTWECTRLFSDWLYKLWNSVRNKSKLYYTYSIKLFFLLQILNSIFSFTLFYTTLHSTGNTSLPSVFSSLAFPLFSCRISPVFNTLQSHILWDFPLSQFEECVLMIFFFSFFKHVIWPVSIAPSSLCLCSLILATNAEKKSYLKRLLLMNN